MRNTENGVMSTGGPCGFGPVVGGGLGSPLSRMAFVSFSTSGSAPGSGQFLRLPPRVTFVPIHPLCSHGALPLFTSMLQLSAHVSACLLGFLRDLKNSGYVLFLYLALVAMPGPQ